MTATPQHAIEARVKKIIAKKLGVPEADVTNEKAFVADLGADSFDTVELVMAIEEEFGIEFPDDESEKISTVQMSIDYVGKRMPVVNAVDALRCRDANAPDNFVDCSRPTAIARLLGHAEQLCLGNPHDEMATTMATAARLLAQKPPPQLSLEWHAWPAQTPISAGLGNGPLLVTMEPGRNGWNPREAFYLEGSWCWPDGSDIEPQADVRLFAAMPAHPASMVGT